MSSIKYAIVGNDPYLKDRASLELNSIAKICNLPIEPQDATLAEQFAYRDKKAHILVECEGQIPPNFWKSLTQVAEKTGIRYNNITLLTEVSK